MDNLQQDEHKAAAIQEANLLKALTEPLHDSIRTDMGRHILLKDLRRGKVLIGGFGPFGAGRMWFNVREDDKLTPGYLSCPVLTKEVEVEGIMNKIRRLENEITELKAHIKTIPD